MIKDLIQELINLEKEKALVEEDIAVVKGQIEKEITEDGYKDDSISISYCKPSTSVSLDTKALKEKEPDLYKELMEDYSKTSTKSGYYKYTIAKEKK